MDPKTKKNLRSVLEYLIDTEFETYRDGRYDKTIARNDQRSIMVLACSVANAVFPKHFRRTAEDMLEREPVGGVNPDGVPIVHLSTRMVLKAPFGGLDLGGLHDCRFSVVTQRGKRRLRLVGRRPDEMPVDTSIQIPQGTLPSRLFFPPQAGFTGLIVLL